MTNEKLGDAYVCLVEIINRNETRMDLPPTGKVVYGLMKNFNAAEPLYKRIDAKRREINSVQEKALEQVKKNSTLAEEEKDAQTKEIMEMAIQDMGKFMNAECEKIEPFHKMSPEDAEGIQRHLKGMQLITFYELFVQDTPAQIRATTTKNGQPKAKEEQKA